MDHEGCKGWGAVREYFHGRQGVHSSNRHSQGDVDALLDAQTRQRYFYFIQGYGEAGGFRDTGGVDSSTREFFETLANTSEPPLSTYFKNLISSNDPKVIHEADREISKNALLHAIMRNTIAPVFLKAGFRGNVIPGSAEATINLRIIPGTDLQKFIADIREAIGDPRVEVSLPRTDTREGARLEAFVKQSASLKPASKDTDLYRALEASSHAVWPGAPVTTYLFQAGTDAIAWRSRGVPVYGIYPYPITAEDLTRMHGNDERVPVESLEQGTEMIYKTLLQVASE